MMPACRFMHPCSLNLHLFASLCLRWERWLPPLSAASCSVTSWQWMPPCRLTLRLYAKPDCPKRGKETWALWWIPFLQLVWSRFNHMQCCNCLGLNRGTTVAFMPKEFKSQFSKSHSLCLILLQKKHEMPVNKNNKLIYFLQIYIFLCTYFLMKLKFTW